MAENKSNGSKQNKSGEELMTNTVVVFGCVIFFAVAFWLIDTGFLAALKGILGITLS